MPDFGQGNWWVKHDDWKGMDFEDGMPLIFDGCRFRFGEWKNTRADGNGVFEWDGAKLNLHFDNNKDGLVVFEEQEQGYWLQGTKFHIKNKGGYTQLDQAVFDKSCASSMGANQIWQKEADKKPTSGLPDLAQGFWWIVHDDWKPYPFRNGMPFFADGCRFRLGDMNNERNDGNGIIEWDGDNLVLRVDNVPDQDRVFT